MPSIWQHSAPTARIATASADKTAKVWDAKTGAVVPRIRGAYRSRRLGGVQPRRRGDRRPRVPTRPAKVWDARDRGRRSSRFEGHGGPVSIRRRSARTARVLTASGRRHGEGLGREDRGPWGSCAEDSRGHASCRSLRRRSARTAPRVVTASWDKTAKVWDAKTGAELRTLKGHTMEVHSASFSPNSTGS